MEFLTIQAGCFNHQSLSCLVELQLSGDKNDPHCAMVLERLLRQARALMHYMADTEFALR